MSDSEAHEQIIEFITVFKKQNDYRPTVREIAEWLDTSVSRTHRLLESCPGLKRVKVSTSGIKWDVIQ